MGNYKGLSTRVFLVFLFLVVILLLILNSGKQAYQYDTIQTRINNTVNILNDQLDQYQTEVNYLVKLYGKERKEQYLKVGSCNCVIRYENDLFNVGYIVEIPIGEHYLFYPSEKFNEFYDKFIIGNENLDSEEIEYYVSFIESKKMTEEGEKDTWSWKLRMIKWLSKWKWWK